MTQEQTKDQEAMQKHTQQQHHKKAVEHHESGDDQTVQHTTPI